VLGNLPATRQALRHGSVPHCLDCPGVTTGQRKKCDNGGRPPRCWLCLPFGRLISIIGHSKPITMQPSSGPRVPAQW
jgi:hypothetical protein